MLESMIMFGFMAIAPKLSGWIVDKVDGLLVGKEETPCEVYIRVCKEKVEAEVAGEPYRLDQYDWERCQEYLHGTKH